MHKRNYRFFPVKAMLIIVIHIVDKPNCCCPRVTGGLWYLALVMMDDGF